MFRHLTMGAFYARAFARRPQRVISLVRNVQTGRHQTRLDRNVADILDRWRNVVPGFSVTRQRPAAAPHPEAGLVGTKGLGQP
jgi:hypothetical protein